MNEAISDNQAHNSDKKRAGRPVTKAPVKKGKSSWKPAALNEFFNKEDGYRYRMAAKDSKTLAKREREGWETVSGVQGSSTEHDSPGRIHDGKNLTSVQEGHDWILQRIPEETALERDAYFNNETERRTLGLTAHLKREMQNKAGNAPIHGNITISSSRGTQVIE